MFPNHPVENRPFDGIIMFLAVVGIITIFGFGVIIGVILMAG